MCKEVIAIDGPAGAGKSTVAKSVAKMLGFRYLDTGAMYRTVALLAMRERSQDGPTVERIAKEMQFAFTSPLVGEVVERSEPGDGSRQRVLANGADVTDLLRTPEVSEAASRLSTYGPLRQELVRRQQEMLAEGRIVIEGRDTTTVVCPDARLKIYLTASVEERARRRCLEMKTKGGHVPILEEIQAQIAERDRRDMNREDSPLRVAEDAVAIDTDKLTVDQVVEAVMSEWHAVRV
ncbi:MAG: (d)CMP kinase [Fimbriimonadales bacterium]